MAPVPSKCAGQHCLFVSALDFARMYEGTGIYTLPDAARLIQVPAGKIHRWLYGYQFTRKSREESVRTFSAPLWTPQLSQAEFDAKVIGFNDLLEVRFVAAFVNHGLPLHVVRACLESARSIVGNAYPLTSGLFKTDGKTIFAEAMKKAVAEGALLDLKTKQLAFKDIISPSLYAGIEYDGQKAKKWYPQYTTSAKQRQVVVDPERQFGSPIVEETGTPTSVLYASYLAEGATQHAVLQTSRAYETSAKLVESAIRYEEFLRRTVH